MTKASLCRNDKLDSMAIQRPKGTNDLLPGNVPAFQRASAHEWLIGVARGVLEKAGAMRIDTPIFEEAELVKRGAGDSSDIVRKEMFSVYYFGDHGGYVLRPEGTASLMRAYLENGLKQMPAPLKLWTSGAMFRAERHQKGRYRQFHQVDYEVLGSDEPLVDAEAIALMVDVVTCLGLKGCTVQLGSLGDVTDRAAYNDYLRELFTPLREELSADSQDRLERNPMRILDSKSAQDRLIIDRLGVRPMLDFLGDDARAHFEAVQNYLTEWNISYTIDPTLVRGLDYYRRTAWELHHSGIGAKSALGGGGRYDGLSEQLGGGAVAGVGWAFGVERLLLALEEEGCPLEPTSSPLLYLAAMDKEWLGLVAGVARSFREGARAEFSYRAMKVPAALREAERRGARWVALVGSREAEAGEITLKNRETGEQITLPIAEITPQALGESPF